MEEAGAAQVSGDLHKGQRLGIKVVPLPSQTMAGENETSLQRKEPRRTPNTEEVCSDLRPRSAKNSWTGKLGRESFGAGVCSTSGLEENRAERNLERGLLAGEEGEPLNRRRKRGKGEGIR